MFAYHYLILKFIYIIIVYYNVITILIVFHNQLAQFKLAHYTCTSKLNNPTRLIAKYCTFGDIIIH